MSIVAIIPARGESKRIPKKNIKSFSGKPIIAYSIVASKESGIFDRIIVSTDSTEIAETARSYGAETPFMRPKELADDYTDTAQVLVHALEWLRINSDHPEYFCCIYATAPFIRAKYIQKGFELLRDNEATSTFSVTTFPYPIFRALKVKTDGKVEMIWPEYYGSRSQDLPEAFHDAGQFYWGDTIKFLEEKTLFSENSIPVILPRHLVQDIDTPEDWTTAEKMFLALKEND